VLQARKLLAETRRSPRCWSSCGGWRRWSADTRSSHAAPGGGCSAALRQAAAGARHCSHLLADCAEAGALGAAGLCRLLHHRAASGNALTHAKTLTLYAARANAPRCAGRSSRPADRAARRGERAGRDARGAAAAVRGARRGAARAGRAHAGRARGGGRRGGLHAGAGGPAPRRGGGAAQDLARLAVPDVLAHRGAGSRRPLARQPRPRARRAAGRGARLPIGPRGLQALLAVATAGAPVAKADSNASDKAQEPAAVAAGIIANKLLNLGGSSFLELAARLAVQSKHTQVYQTLLLHPFR